MKKLFKMINNERGDLPANLIMFPIFIIVFISLIDATIWGINKSQLESIAQGGTQSVRILGGAGTPTQVTPIEKAYGSTVPNDAKSIGLTKSKYSNIELNIINTVQESGSLIGVTLVEDNEDNNYKAVHCTPSLTTSIGQEIKCAIAYKYKVTPLAAITAMMFNGTQIVQNVTYSEVAFDAGSLVSK